MCVSCETWGWVVCLAALEDESHGVQGESQSSIHCDEPWLEHYRRFSGWLCKSAYRYWSQILMNGNSCVTHMARPMVFSNWLRGIRLCAIKDLIYFTNLDTEPLLVSGHAKTSLTREKWKSRNPYFLHVSTTHSFYTLTGVMWLVWF